MNQSDPPRIGQIVAYTPSASPALARIPATVIAVAPRFASGDYLVTLEYAVPVVFRRAYVRHVDAFWSNLESAEHEVPA